MGRRNACQGPSGAEGDNAELSASGFDTAEVDRLLAELNAGNLADVAEPPLPEVPKVARSKRGEVYQLGSHRLMCGDSTSAADVLKLMNGQRAPLCATDPPYLVDYDGGNHPQSFARDEAGKTNNKHWDSYIDPKSSPAAIARLAQLMKQTERPDVAVTAAVALLDRAGVRPWAVDPERLEVMYAGVDSRTILAALLTRRAVAGDVASGAGDAAGDVEPAGS